MNKQKAKEAAATQATALGIGAAFGALTKHATKPHMNRGALAGQVGSAIGAAAATGAGVSGSLAAGAAVVTAKVAAVATFGVAAAPFVAAAGVGYGIYRLWKKL